MGIKKDTSSWFLIPTVEVWRSKEKGYITLDFFWLCWDISILISWED